MKMRAWASIACLFALASGFFAPAGAAPRPVMLFLTSANPDYFLDIRVKYSDGSVSESLNPSHAGVLDAAWSPDGTRIAFAGIANACSIDPLPDCAARTTMAIWIMNADGSAPVQVQLDNPKAWARAPEWSPDGKRIVYVRWGPDDDESDKKYPNPDLWVLTDGGNDTWSNEPLVARRGYEYLAEFSPDGRSIAYGYSLDNDAYYQNGEPYDFEIFVSDADGSGPHRRLTHAIRRQTWTNPSWSPDGQWIAYNSGKRTMLIRRDGSDQRVLASFLRPVYFTDFSADGDEVAMTECDEFNACRIVGVGVERPHRKRVIVDLAESFESMPDWFPIP